MCSCIMLTNNLLVSVLVTTRLGSIAAGITAGIIGATGENSRSTYKCYMYKVSFPLRQHTSDTIMM